MRHFDLRHQSVEQQYIAGHDIYIQQLAAPLSLTVAEYRRNRSRMLAKVHAFWITEVLEKSLHAVALLELKLQEQPSAIANPWGLIVQESNQPAHLLPQGTSITQVCDEAGGELLILGEPGSGKTTLLLQLARDLLNRAEQDESLPMPVVFNLSSWAVKRQPLSDWLVQELNSRYQVPRKLAQAWIDSDQILPLLDGLDEVAQEHRVACITAINTYRREHGIVPTVVCSRSADYFSQSAHLALRQAVVVQPLTQQQVDAYLAGAGEKLAAVRVALHHDPTLQELATTPLMLNVLTLAYAERPVDDLLVASPYQTKRQQIFKTYIERMLHRRRLETYYTPEQTIHWLSQLARQMAKQSQTVFHLERMQPNWLPEHAVQRFSYGPLVRVNIALLFGLFAGLAFVLYRAFLTTPEEVLAYGLYGLFSGRLYGPGNLLAYALLFGLFSGLIYGLTSRVETAIKPAEVITWSWGSILRDIVRRKALPIGLVFGILGGILGALLGTSEREGVTMPFSVAISGLLFGFLGGLLFDLLPGLIRELPKNVRKEQPFARPNQGIWQSVRNHVFVGLIFGLPAGLIFGILVGLYAGLVAGLVGGLFYGVSYVLLVGLQYGLISGVLFGLLSGLILGLTSQVETDLRPVKVFVWLWGSIWHCLVRSEVLTRGLTFGLIYGLFFGLNDWLVVGPVGGLFSGLVFGLVGGLIYGLFSGLVSGLSSKMVEEQTLVRPNQGIWRSAGNSVRVGLLFGLLAGLVFGLLNGLDNGLMLEPGRGLRFGLGTGASLWLLAALLIALPNGGAACIQHGALRLLLWRAGSIPWHYTRFLDYAADAILLRKVGGGYIFIHRLLLEYFASLNTIQLSLQKREQVQDNQSEVCTCGYRYPPGARFCSSCGKPKVEMSTEHVRDILPASAPRKTARANWWREQVLKINPAVLLRIGLAVGILVASWLALSQSLHSYPSAYTNLVLDDPLSTNRGILDVGTASYGTCQFIQGAYQVTAKGKEGILCETANTNFSDFTLEVQMVVAKGDSAFLVFRFNKKPDLGFYLLTIRSDQGYELSSYRNRSFNSLASGSNLAINYDSHKPQLIAVVARGDTFELYANHQFITTVNDKDHSLTQGSIGFAVLPIDNTPGQVLYRNMRVWINSPIKQDLSPANSYPPPHWNLILNDPMKNSKGIWYEGTGSEGSSCRFVGDAYQITRTQAGSFHCTAGYTGFPNFAFEVQVTIVKARGGIMFRMDEKSGSFYYLRIDPSGSYTLFKVRDTKSAKTLASGNSTAINKGLNQPNLIAIVVQGNTFELLTNHQLITTVSDKDSPLIQGNIGLAASTPDNSPSEVLYRNAKIWTPSR